jgi:hypothetical protein
MMAPAEEREGLFAARRGADQGGAVRLFEHVSDWPRRSKTWQVDNARRLQGLAERGAAPFVTEAPTDRARQRGGPSGAELRRNSGPKRTMARFSNMHSRPPTPRIKSLDGPRVSNPRVDRQPPHDAAAPRSNAPRKMIAVESARR